MSRRIKKYRPTTEQLIFLILYRYNRRDNESGFGITVKEIRKELAFEVGRKPSTRHIRSLLVHLEEKGAIERDFN